MRFLVASPIVSVTRPLWNFSEGIKNEFKEWRLSEKTALALRLYNASHYHDDSEVRFLSLVTVIEVLAQRKRQRDIVEEFLSACIENLPETLTDDEADALESGFGHLKSQSISQACRRIVGVAGADPEFMRRCYKARSELLHDGESSTYPDIPKQTAVVDDLVRKVLIWSIEAENS